MSELNYQTPKPSKIMKLFWKAAGGDQYILSKSTYSDQIKYFCLGGIVVATAIMAGLSGGYAFYTIFKPKASDVSELWEKTGGANTINNLQGFTESTDIGTTIIALVFGLIWGLIIYNIDRFIVTSTGTGDGSEAITWGELKGALPRIIMGCIIAISISKPLEIRILKGEIDAKLQVKQERLKEDAVKTIEEKYVSRISEKNATIAKYQREIDNSEDALTKAEMNLNAEMTQEGSRGYGPQAKRLDLIMQDRKLDRDNMRSRIDPLIEDLNKEIKGYVEEKNKEIDNISVGLSGLDGLAERITIAEEEYPTVSIFLMLLFLAIELTPIFFKLMLIKSPYDYMSSNYKALELANNGIYIEEDYYEDKKGVQRELVRFLNAEKQIQEKKEFHDAQIRITKYAIEKFEASEKKKIDNNPEDFIKYS
jgi:transcriptional regulator of NAD metabolism